MNPQASTPIIEAARCRKCLTSRFHDYRPAKTAGNRDRWHPDLVCTGCGKPWWVDDLGFLHTQTELHRHRANVQRAEKRQRKRANRRALRDAP